MHFLFKLRKIKKKINAIEFKLFQICLIKIYKQYRLWY